jgi:hypothetical protein
MEAPGGEIPGFFIMQDILPRIACKYPAGGWHSAKCDGPMGRLSACHYMRQQRIGASLRRSTIAALCQFRCAKLASLCSDYLSIS